MNKKIIIIAIFGIGGLILLNSLGKRRQPQPQTLVQAETQVKQSPSADNVSLAPADKIEVVNFFGTQRCVSCLTIGKFTKKTLEEKFALELESGKIVFKEINGELPENKEIVVKYQARGSSLFINAIRGEAEDVSEDTMVWRLVNSEEQFVSYLEKKLNKLLGNI